MTPSPNKLHPASPSPASAGNLEPSSLTPREIVAELDRFIVGQTAAKRAVSVALRNRWRRAQVEGSMRDEILPKNILMVGPTGVGKTEIARRLAKLAKAPFLKIEATKFTEVGYVGRDVDSIVRDLVDSAIKMVRAAKHKDVEERAKTATEERLLNALVGETASPETRAKFRTRLHNGELEDKEIDIELADAPQANFDVPGMPGGMSMINLNDILGKAMGTRMKTKRMSVALARAAVLSEESDKLLDQDTITQEALHAVENNGIVFIDEIDKIATRSELRGGDVSREGVQRDLLPLIEGTTVATKYGPVKTDHILFIASGAFHMAKPSDLLPELQGRLPIRVELSALTEGDLVSILTEPECSLTKQYTALMATEGVRLSFTPEGISQLASIAARVNREVENIGARRLHTILEKLLENLSFNASDQSGTEVQVDAGFVSQQLDDLAKNTDLSKFIL
ncbi:MAG: ATP-dependent protease ATPase subunit HslU [Proteobacteria bacterium]|nr:ATP-dependent protease ATPase subunit HslU [Pseudomonadota bacterium]